MLHCLYFSQTEYLPSVSYTHLYALLPVWILNTKWEDKDFLFAMNGQTGKLVGNLPVSTKRVVGLFAAIAAPLIAISVTALLLLAR